WQEVEFAERYHLQVATDAGFSNIVIDENNLPLPSFQASSLAPLTTYHWRVKSRNTSGESAWSQTSVFRTIGQPFQTVLVSPRNDSVVTGTVKAVWRKPAEMTETILGYHIQVSAFQDFSTLAFENQSVTDTSVNLSNLNFDTRYYWRVRARNEVNFGSWSQVWSFRTIIQTPDATVLFRPSDFTEGLLNPVTLVWRRTPRAASYTLEVSENNFASLIHSAAGLTDTSRAVSVLQPGRTYQWRVKAHNDGGVSVSSAFRFNTLPMPGTVTLNSPQNNAVNTEFASLTLRWLRQPVILGNTPKYDLQIATDQSFSNLFTDQSDLNDSMRTVQGLEPLRTYYWRVRAKNAAGTGAWSSVRSFQTKNAPPDIVALLSPANNSKGLDRNVSLKWSKRVRAEQYRVQVSQLPGFNGLIKIDTVITDTTVLISLSDLYKDHFWRVKAINVIGESDWSQAFSFKTKGVALAPNLVTPVNNAINQGPSQIRFVWNRAGEQIEQIQNYRLQVSSVPTFENDSLFVNHVTTDTFSTHFSFPRQKTFYWRVRATNENGDGEWSDVFKLRTTPLSAPGVTTLSAPVNTEKGVDLPVTLRWRDTPAADFYILQVSTDSLFNFNVYANSDLSDTFQTVNNLSGLTKYYWKVAAWNTLGGGANNFSPVYSFTTVGNPFAATLSEPAQYSVNVAVDSVVFKWNKPGERTEEIRRYDLQVSTDSTFQTLSISLASVQDTFRVISGLSMQRKYFWRVRAVNNSGNGDWSNVYSFTTGLFAPAKPVLALPANNGGPVWRPVLFVWNRSDGASHYRIQLSINDSLFRNIYPNEFEFDVENIYDTVYPRAFLTRNGTDYFWRVKAYNAAGESDWSQFYSFRSAGGPGTVTLYSPAENENNVPLNSVPFAWSFSGNVLPDLTTYYATEFYTHPDLSFFNRVYPTAPHTNPEDTTRMVSNLRPGTTYWWRVESYNYASSGGFSAVRRFTTVFTAVPTVPQLVSPINNQIAIQPPPQFKFRRAEQASQYFAQVSKDSLFNDLVYYGDLSSTDTSFTINNLEPYITYFWRVKSFNGLGESNWSEVRRFKTYGLPYLNNPVIPENNAVDQPVNGLKFAWRKAGERIEAIFNYRLQIATDSNFVNLFYDDQTLTDTSKIINGLSGGTRYYWRVNAKNQIGWGEWSPYFSFETIRPVTVTSPNGGELLGRTKNAIIRWTGSPSVPVNIELTTNAGGTWQTIASNYSSADMSYNWQVPDISANQCRIRINYVQQGFIADESDNLFSIVDYKPELLAWDLLFYPESGQPYQGFTYYIKYKSAENKPPAAGYPRVEIFLNNSLHSTVTLNDQQSGNNDYTDGKLFFNVNTFFNLGNYKIRFTAVDIDGDTAVAYPDPANLVNGPVIEQFSYDLAADPAAAVSPSSFLEAGQLFNVNGFIRNTTLFTVQNVNVQFKILRQDGTVYQEVRTNEPLIPANSFRTTAVFLIVNDPGTYLLKFTVDPDNTIAEKDENNNSHTQTIIIGNPSSSVTMSSQTNNTNGTNYNPSTVSGQSGYNLGGLSQSGNTVGVSGGTVKVTINGVDYSGRTQSDGSYNIPVPGLTAGTYNAVTEVTDGVLTSTSNSVLNISSYQAPPGQSDIRDISVNSIIPVTELNLTGRQESAIIRVRNNGNAVLNGVKLHLLLNGIIADSVVTGTIQPSSVSDVVMKFTPSQPGTSNLAVVADPFFAIDEVSKNNNRLFREISVTSSLPDLSISNITVPEIVKVNTGYNLRATVTNNGNTDITTQFTVAFFAGGTQAGTRIVSGLAKNQSLVIDMPFAVSDTGNQLFRVVADASNTITESLENNNENGLIKYVSPLLPNLRFREEEFIITPVLPQMGDSVYFSIPVVNNGEQASAPTQVRFSVAGSQYTSVVNVPVIQPGADTVISSAVPYIVPVRGTFNGRAEVNFNNSQRELTLFDNNALRTFVSGTGSDLAIDSASHIIVSNPYIKPDGSVTISAKVTNKLSTAASGTVEFSFINTNGQRQVIGNVPVSVQGGQQAITDSVLFTLPFTPAILSATIKSVQPPDVNTFNNERNLIAGDVAPVITLPDTLRFDEDSSLVISLDSFVTDPGDPVSVLAWTIAQGGNLTYEISDLTRVLRISAPSNYYGKQTVRFNVFDNYYTTTKFVTVDVKQVIDYPAVPELVSPADGVKGLLNPVSVVWRDGINTEVFRLQASTDSLFSAGMIKDTLAADTTFVLSDLPLFSTIYWRVRGENDETAGQWSNVNKFKTLGNPYASNLSEPVNNGINQRQDTLLFRWTKARERIETIQRYQFQLSTDSLFSSYRINDSTLTDTLFRAENLGYLTGYFWRVRASNETGWGDWSQVWRFTTIIERPLTPFLVSPADNGTGIINPVTAAWRGALRAEKYRIQLADNSGFNNPVFDDANVTDTVKQLPHLSSYTQYYWRVKSLNAGGESDWSTSRSFRTLGLPFTTAQVTPLNNSQNLRADSIRFVWRMAGEQNDRPVMKQVKVRSSALDEGADSGEGTAYYTEAEEAAKTTGSRVLKGSSLTESILGYNLLIVTDTLNMNIQYNDTTLTDTTVAVTGFANLTDYYWKIRAKNQNGWGDFSGWYKFTTIIAAPEVPVLSSPANNASGLLNPVTAVWRGALRSEKYRIQLSDNSGFTNLILDDGNVTDTMKQLPQLNIHTQYYWRVKAINAGGESNYSEVRSFRTLGLPLTVTTVQPALNSVNQPVANLNFIWRKAGEQTLAAVKGGGNKKQAITEDSDEESSGRNGLRIEETGLTLTSGSVTEGGENILRYWLQVKTDTASGAFFFNDSTLTDTVKNLSGLTYFTEYYWRVKAQNETGWGEYTQWIKFRTIIERPGVSTLASPQNDAKGLINPVTTVWNRSLRAERYRLQVSDNANFTTLIVNDSTITDTSKTLTALTNYTQYYWRVKAYNIGGESDWSTVFNFKTLGNPYASNLIEPANQSVNQPVNGVVFKWRKPAERIEAILGYHYQLSADSLFGTTVVNDSTLTDTIRTVNGLTNLTTYYWRVRAKNQAGWGDWSSRWSLTTIVSAPGQVVLVSPANNATDQSVRPRFTWNRVQIAERYRFELASDQNFQNIVVLDTMVTDTAKNLTADLNWKTKYYWRVRAANIGGTGSYSTIFSFTTQKEPVAAPSNLQATWLLNGRV
ncbi:MAG: fibronectin type III domain-containing protein, partial [Ignavibacteriaceae bacterium]|nr:fibronectin type III domain-containing protein [Ignavibacteriaceae bacterium]